MVARCLNIICGIFLLFVISFSAGSLVPLINSELSSEILGAGIAVLLVITACFMSSALGKTEKFFHRLIKNRPENSERIFCIMAVFLVILQVNFAYNQDFTPKNDLSYICRGAENLVMGKPLYYEIPDIHKHYFAVYPNNHMLFTIIYFLYKVEYILTGNITNALPVTLNIISLGVSYIFMYMTAKIIFSAEKSLVCALCGFAFTPLITYSSFFYTDSMAMPFVTVALYLYVKCCATDSTDILHMALCGAVTAFGYKIKGSTGLLIPSAVIDMVFSRRKNIKNISVMIISFAVCCVVFGKISSFVIGVECMELERYRFPLIHWIMMSADGRGGYCSEDFRYTLGFQGYENKITADIQRLFEKLSAQGITGFLIHIVRKISYTWRDGTFMAGYYNKYGFLKSYGFYLFTALCHFTLMFKIAGRYISVRDISGNKILKIMFMILVAFLMVWETRCRYLVSFFAIFVLI